MAHMNANTEQNKQSNTFDENRNNSSISKCFLKWRGQSEESLKKQNAIFRKACYSHILFCFNLNSSWFSYLVDMDFPVKVERLQLLKCMTYNDLDCILLVEDIFNILIRLSKSDVYLQKMLDAMKKMEMNLQHEKSADVLLGKVNDLQIVHQTWNEVFLQFEASKSKKILILFLMKLYQQHVTAFDASVDSWQEMKRISIQDARLGDSLHEKGKELVKNGNLRDALESFNEAILNCPLEARNYKERAKVHLLLNKYKLCSSDLIRVHVLEPEWEEGYVIHRKIFKNLDEVWTEYYLKLVENWRDSVGCLYTAGKDTPFELAEENGFGPGVKIKEVQSSSSQNDRLVWRAMNLYKHRKYKEVLQIFKPNTLETTFYRIALLSLVHLKRLAEARQLAFTATETFIDMRKFSRDENEAKNLKKMFNFIKSIPRTPFAECDICKNDRQSTSIYLYNDLSVLDDLFHQGCVVLLCGNRCKVAFHFECLSGSTSFAWTQSCLENYVGGMCTAPDCQSRTFSAEAFFVDDTKPIKFPGCSDTNLGAGNFYEQNNSNSSSDEATLPSDLLESPAEYTAFPCSPSAQASALNFKDDTNSLPSYKEYEGKKPGRKKKRRPRNVLPAPTTYHSVDNNQESTETSQLEDHTKNGSVSSQSSDIEKENLLLYLLSVLHEHGPQSENGEIFQIEMKTLNEEHKKIIDENGGLAFFLCQSNNVLLKEPDILYLNPDTLTTVISDSDHFPSQTDQASAVTENLASNVNPRTSISFRPEERASLGRNNREEFEASNQNMPLRRPNAASGYADEYSSNASGGFPKQGFVDEGIKKRNLRPDKREMTTNILDESFSDSSSSSSGGRSSNSSSNSSYNQISERGKESSDDDDDDDDFFGFSGDESVNSSDSVESDLRACEMCAEFKQRLVTLEQSYKNALLQYDGERRKVELAEVEISLLKSQLSVMKKEIQQLKGKNDDVSSSEGMEASNHLRSGKRSSHNKDSSLAPLETSNLCVICHEHLLRGGANMRLKCGHTFHNYCIRKWLGEQATCPSCRKHTLLADEFPPLV